MRKQIIMKLTFILLGGFFISLALSIILDGPILASFLAMFGIYLVAFGLGGEFAKRSRLKQ